MMKKWNREGAALNAQNDSDGAISGQETRLPFIQNESLSLPISESFFEDKGDQIVHRYIIICQDHRIALF